MSKNLIKPVENGGFGMLLFAFVGPFGSFLGPFEFVSGPALKLFIKIFIKAFSGWGLIIHLKDFYKNLSALVRGQSED